MHSASSSGKSCPIACDRQQRDTSLRQHGYDRHSANNSSHQPKLKATCTAPSIHPYMHGHASSTFGNSVIEHRPTTARTRQSRERPTVRSSHSPRFGSYIACAGTHERQFTGSGIRLQGRRFTPRGKSAVNQPGSLERVRLGLAFDLSTFFRPRPSSIPPSNLQLSPFP